MSEFDFEQRLEEIELALADLFESPKAPSVSVIDEGDTLAMHLSWVVATHGDTTLDSRCAATLRAPRAQFERYARLDTTQRRVVQQRIRARVRSGFGAGADPLAEACSVDVTLDDATFEAQDDRDYVPRL